MGTTHTHLITTAAYREILAQRSRRLNLVVAKAPIVYQLGRGWPPAYDGPELPAAPGHYSFDRIFDTVRIKSAAAAAAEVDVETVSAQELPDA